MLFFLIRLNILKRKISQFINIYNICCNNENKNTLNSKKNNKVFNVLKFFNLIIFISIIKLSFVVITIVSYK